MAQKTTPLLHYINLYVSLSHVTETKTDLGYSETEARGPEFQQ